MEVASLLRGSSLPLVLSIASLLVTVLCVAVVRRRRRHAAHASRSSKLPQKKTSRRSAVLRLLGIRLGGAPAIVVGDGAVAADALVRRADAFSDRPLGSGPTSIISGGRHHNINTVPYGPLWVALRRNLTSEAFHPVRGLARAAPLRSRALADIVGQVSSRSSSGDDGGGGVVVPVRDCLDAALFRLNVAMCFGDGVDDEVVEAMRAEQRAFVGIIARIGVFATFQRLARLVYWDRWKELMRCRRRQVALYMPLIRARQERSRSTTTTCDHAETMTTYLDTLLDLEVPAAEGGDRRRKLSDGEIVGLLSEYLGAATGTVLAQLEWTLAILTTRPDIQSRLRGEIEAASGEPCAYLRAVVMESLRWHPPVPFVQRHLGCDVLLGGAHVPRGTVVNFSLQAIGRDNKIWSSPKEYSPDRFMAGGEGAGVRLAVGSKEAANAMMMPFGAGRRTCPGTGYAILHLEYFIINLVTAFEWRPVPGEEVDLTPHYGFVTTMKRPLRALVVPRTTTTTPPAAQSAA